MVFFFALTLLIALFSCSLSVQAIKKVKCRTWPHFVDEDVEGDGDTAEPEQEFCTDMWKKISFKL